MINKIQFYHRRDSCVYRKMVDSDPTNLYCFSSEGAFHYPVLKEEIYVDTVKSHDRYLLWFRFVRILKVLRKAEESRIRTQPLCQKYLHSANKEV